MRLDAEGENNAQALVQHPQNPQNAQMPQNLTISDWSRGRHAPYGIFKRQFGNGQVVKSVIDFQNFIDNIIE